MNQRFNRWKQSISENKSASILCFVFLTLLFGITIASTINPTKVFSENENRYLATKPKFTTDDLLSGKFTSNYEEYITDQFVMRDQWIGLKTSTERLMLKQDINGVYFGKDGYLIEKHTIQDIDEVQAQKNSDRLVEFTKKYTDLLGKDSVKVMLVPTASDILTNKLPPYASGYDQKQFIENIKDRLQNNLIDIKNQLTDKNEEYIFYKTDHHWTSLGAYYAYETWAEAVKETPWKQEDFQISEVTDQFYGTIYSKVNTKVTPDKINLYLTKEQKEYKVDYNQGEKEKDSLYDMEKLEGKDKYSVFLGGNNAVVDIKTTNNNNKKLLVLKDSFAHSFVPFAANHYEEVIMIDFRYYNKNISEFIEENEITDILVLYNVINFAKDKNTAKFLK